MCYVAPGASYFVLISVFYQLLVPMSAECSVNIACAQCVLRISFVQLRSAYRVEIKRCHPDAAGADANEFRVKALERRFVRLTTSWETFVNARQNPSSRERSTQRSPTNYSEESANRSEAPADSERRRAPRQRRRRQPMDEGRENLDIGGSSC